GRSVSIRPNEDAAGAVRQRIVAVRLHSNPVAPDVDPSREVENAAERIARDDAVVNGHQLDVVEEARSAAERDADAALSVGPRLRSGGIRADEEIMQFRGGEGAAG